MAPRLRARAADPWRHVRAGASTSPYPDISSGTLLAVALQAVLGGVVYLALFFTVASAGAIAAITSPG
jgi:hypothetical protein